MANDSGLNVVASGFLQLLLSQLSTRVITFFLNLGIVRHLSPEAYGLASVQFHLITSTILLLSREGLRRGCLRFKPDQVSSSVDARRVLSVAWLVIPAGLIVTSAVVSCVLYFSTPASGSAYRTAVMLHGFAGLVELAAEPLYVLALVNLRFKLRAGVDTAALLLKTGLTLLLVSQTKLEPALVFSLAQIAFALLTVFAYLAFIGPEAIECLRRRPGSKDGQPLWGIQEREVLWMSSLFSFQSVEKQVLAEGSKLVLVTVQSQFNQGVYGLVGNLGSLVVRTLFQPLEEIAFATFSRFQVTANESRANLQDQAAKSSEPGSGLSQLAAVLSILVKSVCLLGLLSASFGPAYAYMLIRLVYSTRWSETEAPTVLAFYSVYILLLSINGITEAFVHAVLDSRGIQQTNMLLVAFSVAHVAASVVCINAAGAVGLVLADSINMTLRIICSLWYIHCHFLGLPTFRLTQLLPRPVTLGVFAGVSMVCLASQHFFLPLGAGAAVSTGVFLKQASWHTAVGVVCLGAVGASLLTFERDLLRSLKGLGSLSKGAREAKGNKIQ